MKKFDILTPVGIFLGIGALLVAEHMEGGTIASLIDLPAVLIVIGGTIAATMIQSHMTTFLKAIKMFSWIVRPPEHNLEEMVDQLVEWSKAKAKKGPRVLEEYADDIKDGFIRKGLQMAADNMSADKIHESLFLEIERDQEVEEAGAKSLEDAGGYAPTFGILGAVTGLIHVMDSLGNPSKLGAGIATAFVATVYGLMSANFLFIPSSKKIIAIIEERTLVRTMFLDGITSIVRGDNTIELESKLRGYLSEARRRERESEFDS